MEINFRCLGSGDSERYREIRLESLKAHPEAFGSSYEEQRLLPKLMFEKALEQPVDDRFVVGAFDRETLIGICGFVPFVLDDDRELPNAGTIIQMYVRPPHRNRKIGLNLVNAVIEKAFGLPKIEQIVLGVNERNKSAMRVYEEAGFRTLGSEHVGEGTSEVGFRWMVLQRGS
jgi:RimJ/RimL family protein N-acetyltransferase